MPMDSEATRGRAEGFGPIVLFILRLFFVYLAFSVGCFLMIRIVLEYTALRDDVLFLNQKTDYLGDPIWKAAFYVHTFSAVLALLAGFTQFSDYFLKTHRRWHRLIGRFYAFNILLVNVPAGMVLALNANGRLPGRIGFVVLDLLWFWFTWRGVQAARARNFSAHRIHMIYSFALTFSAVTLRTWKMILSNAYPFDPVQLYMIDAWLGFVPNLAVAAWLNGWGSRSNGRMQRPERTPQFAPSRTHTHRS